MATDNGGGGSYEVVLESLTRAAGAVETVTAAVDVGSVTRWDASVDTGHPGLQASLADFCARWGVGVADLVGRTGSVSARLNTVAAVYFDNDVDRMRLYQALGGG